MSVFPVVAKAVVSACAGSAFIAARIGDIFRDQGGTGSAEILAQAQALTRKLIGVEEHLTQLRTTGTGQDGVRWPAQVSERLRYLIGNTATGDYRPTDQTGEVHQVLKTELEDARRNLSAVASDEFV